MNKKLEGKYAVVTGAARGIGEAIARRLYDDGVAGIAILDIDQESAEKAARNIDGSGKIAYGFSCNVADRQQINEVFSLIKAQFGRIDILVNNAGITRDSMFHKMEDEQWDAVLAVNLNGVYNCCKAVISDMREQKYGKIVNLASVSAFGNIGQTNYGATKAAVIGLTKCLAKEVARNNITVNAIAPSYVETDMMRAVPEKVRELFLSNVPAQRFAEPSEIAAVAAFLASDDSSFVTGECIVASGGSYM
ncbi:MAG TPA: 3-oxoacyl-ACP reductase FabG [Clostridiales bacterium]|nr:3-oxoacyl-ACP reductase FabG [Clostridiales bacterium]